VDSLAAAAGKYLEMGMKQFPSEWRNYWAAAFVYEAAGQKAKAQEVLNRGLEKCSGIRRRWPCTLAHERPPD
jgi:hypothetical protein